MLRNAFFLFGAAIQVVPMFAQPGSDSQVTQALVSEIRELRQDLLTTAATIQRVQIGMYRLQAEAGLLDKATQRFDQARMVCKQAEAQQKSAQSQIEQVELRKRSSQEASIQGREEQFLVQLQASLGQFGEEASQCQAERLDAENQFRAEQAKMSELQDQLDRLDQALAAQAKK